MHACRTLISPPCHQMPEVELREGSPVIHKAPPKKLNRWSKPKVYEKLSNNEYQCIRCHKILPRMRAVTKHFDLVHGPKEEQCNICQKYVRDKPHLIKHKIKVGVAGGIVCSTEL